MTLTEFAMDSIKLFLEYRDRHGYDENMAMQKAALDMGDTDVGFAIVAAAERDALLEALESVMNAESCLDSQSRHVIRIPADVMADIRAAIAKAKGEPC